MKIEDRKDATQSNGINRHPKKMTPLTRWTAAVVAAARVVQRTSTINALVRLDSTPSPALLHVCLHSRSDNDDSSHRHRSTLFICSPSPLPPPPPPWLPCRVAWTRIASSSRRRYVAIERSGGQRTRVQTINTLHHHHHYST